MSEQDNKQDFEDCYQEAIAHWDHYLREAQIDHKMTMNDQWDATQKSDLELANRAAYVYNKMHRVIKLVTGYQRKNRLAYKVDPVEGSDELTANQFSGLVQWIAQSSNLYNTMSDAFEQGPLKTGINLVEIYIDKSEDPVSGDIKFKRIPYNKCLLDPNFAERDLDEDCSYLLRRDWMPKEHIKILCPWAKSEIEKMVPKGRDNKFTYYYPVVNIEKRKLLTYDSFYRQEFKPVQMVGDPNFDVFREWKGSKEELADLLVKYPKLEVIDSYKKNIKLTIFVNGEEVYNDDDPMDLGGYPYVALLGFWDPEYNKSQWKLRAFARIMRDPQKAFNKRWSNLIDIVEKQVSSGWEGEEDALVDPQDAYQTGAGTVRFYQKGKFKSGERVPPAQIPPGLLELAKAVGEEIFEIPGANQELFGLDNDTETAAVLAKLRQGAGLTVLQDLFDNYLLGKKLMGNKIIKTIQNNYKPQKVQRILNQKPSDEFYEESFGKYDAIPCEGILSDSQRQMCLLQLLNYKRSGMPLPWSYIIELTPVENKQKLMEAIQQEEQKMAQQAKDDEMMKQLTQGMMQSKIQSDVANAAEKRSQSIENRSNAVYDKVKTIREIQNMDTENLAKLVELVKSLESLWPQEISAKEKPQIPQLTRR